MNKTIEYYDQNAEEYASKTFNADMHYAYERFCFNTFKDAKILDLGCGSGRDSLYFLRQGMQVHAIDASQELAQIASFHTGIDVQVKDIRDFDENDQYDAIWACASLLHLSMQELEDVFPKLIQALHLEGIIYMSFKYGEFEGIREGRYYTDMTIEKACAWITQCKGALLLECWKSHDRLNRDTTWLNLIVRKVSQK